MSTGVISMEPAHHPTNLLRCKVVVVGDQHTGKTSLIQAYMDAADKNKKYVMTIDTDLDMKVVDVPDRPASRTSEKVEMYIFDSAGASIFGILERNTKYWNNANMVVAVYDVSDRESFTSIPRWIQRVRTVSPNLSGVLIANKIDLTNEDRRIVTEDEGKKYAQELGLEYFETSTTVPTNVDKPFTWMVKCYSEKFNAFIQAANTLV